MKHFFLTALTLLLVKMDVAWFGCLVKGKNYSQLTLYASPCITCFIARSWEALEQAAWHACATSSALLGLHGARRSGRASKAESLQYSKSRMLQVVQNREIAVFVPNCYSAAAVLIWIPQCSCLDTGTMVQIVAMVRLDPAKWMLLYQGDGYRTATVWVAQGKGCGVGATFEGQMLCFPLLSRTQSLCCYSTYFDKW